MAVKKIRLDFSKVEERSSWNKRAIPEGPHKMKVESVEMTEAATDGTDMLVFALRPDGKYKTRLFPYYCKLQQNQYWKLRDLLVAVGVAVPKRVGDVDPNKAVGKFIAAEVVDVTGQYAGQSEINGIYGLDILDGDDSGSDDAGDEEDESEEYDDEPEGAEEEDDEEDELDGMTLPQLRKFAKELGMTGYTKLSEEDLIEAIREEQDGAEEEDDLDDEDLEDEDLDDEEFEDEDDEEDEPPAPRRRAAAKPAPARRAPAKAAAAPARRVVKRR